MNNHTAKAIATIASAAVCGLLIFTTKGEHGIGWFFASLIIIW